MIRALLTAALAFWVSPAFAQDAPIQIGAVNLSYVARSSKAGKSGLAEVEAFVKQKQSESAAKAAALEKQRIELQQRPGLSQRAIADLQKAFDRSRIEFERFQQDAQNDIEAMQTWLDVDFRAKLAPVIDAISKEKGLHFVFGLEQAAIVWWSPAVDISEEVVKRLDAGK